MDRLKTGLLNVFWPIAPVGNVISGSNYIYTYVESAF